LAIARVSFFLNLPNIASADEILETVRGVDGVKAARIEIVEERVELYGLFGEELAGKLKETRTTMTMAS
jgi:hypothetical protein